MLIAFVVGALGVLIVAALAWRLRVRLHRTVTWTPPPPPPVELRAAIPNPPNPSTWRAAGVLGPAGRCLRISVDGPRAHPLAVGGPLLRARPARSA